MSHSTAGTLLAALTPMTPDELLRSLTLAWNTATKGALATPCRVRLAPDLYALFVAGIQQQRREHLDVTWKRLCYKNGTAEADTSLPAGCWTMTFDAPPPSRPNLGGALTPPK